MQATLDSQIIDHLALALEPAVVRAVERTVREVLERSIPSGSRASRTSPISKSDYLITVKEVAKYLSVAKSTVWEMVKRGELPSIRVGPRSRRFRIGDVKALARKI